jgi:O-antigen/teichoic acid export membrane protein
VLKLFYIGKFTAGLLILSQIITNILTVGIISRVGGIAFVGDWVLLLAFFAIGMVVEGGITTYVSRLASQKDIEKAKNALLSLSIFMIISVSSLVLVFFVLSFLHSDILIYGLAFAAGLVCAASKWLLASSLAEGRLFYLHGASIARHSLILFGIMFASFILRDRAWGSFVLSGVLFSSAILELIISYTISRSWLIEASEIRIGVYSIRDWYNYSKGFKLLTFSQALQEPIWRFLLGGLFGAVALGNFAISLRLPQIIKTFSAEALRGLVPIVARLATLDDVQQRSTAGPFLTNIIPIQFALVAPPIAFIFFYAPGIIELWLGDGNPEAAAGARIFGISALISTFSGPAFWILQALGREAVILRGTIINFIIVVFLGFALMVGYNNAISAFAASFVIAQVVVGILLFEEVRKTSIFDIMFSMPAMGGMISILSLSFGVNWILVGYLDRSHPLYEVVLALLINAALVGFCFLGIWSISTRFTGPNQSNDGS